MAEAMKRGSRTASVPRVEYLGFLLGGDPYAAPVTFVREILRPPPLTRVPRAPAGVLGIVSVRGQLVTVVDPRHRLGGSAVPLGPRARIVLVHGKTEEIMGIVVEEVLQVFRIAENEIESRTAALGDATAAHITGIARFSPGHRGGGRARTREAARTNQGARAPSEEQTVLVLLDLHALLSS